MCTYYFKVNLLNISRLPGKNHESRRIHPKSYDRTFLEVINAYGQHDLVFFEARLTLETSVLATGLTIICALVNDQLDVKIITKIAQTGFRLKDVVSTQIFNERKTELLVDNKL